MKQIGVLMIVFLFCLSCADEWQEEITQTAPVPEEKELWQWSREELMKIDETLYDELSHNEEFQSLCKQYRTILDSLTSDDTTTIASLTSWHSSMKKLGEQKACKNIATYVLRYVRERPATRIDLPEVVVFGTYRLWEIWEDMWTFYDIWSFSANAFGVSKHNLEDDIYQFLNMSPFCGWDISHVYEKVLYTHFGEWRRIHTVYDFLDFFEKLGLYEVSLYYPLVDYMYNEIQNYFIHELWKGLLHPVVPIPSPPPPPLPPPPPPPPPSPVAPTAKEIFKGDLSDAEWKRVEEMIKDIIADCMGGKLYNGIQAMLSNGTKIALTIGGIEHIGESSEGKITLNSLAESDALLHELFHSYQRANIPIDTWQSTSISREIEARLAGYRYAQKLSDEKRASSWHGNNPESQRTEGLKNINIFLDTKGNLEISKNEASALKAMEEYHMYLNRIGYSGEFDRGKGVAGNLKSLRELSKDC
jgi:hypothetical protein